MGSGKSAAATEGQAPPRAIGLMEELSQDPEEFRGDPRREPGRLQVSQLSQVCLLSLQHIAKATLSIEAEIL